MQAITPIINARRYAIVAAGYWYQNAGETRWIPISKDSMPRYALAILHADEEKH